MKGHSYTRVLGALGWVELGFCAISEGKIVIFVVILHYIRSKNYQKFYFFWNDNRIHMLSFVFSVFLHIFTPGYRPNLPMLKKNGHVCFSSENDNV